MSTERCSCLMHMVEGSPHASFTKPCPPLPLFHWCFTADEPNVFVPASGKKSTHCRRWRPLQNGIMLVCVCARERKCGALCALTWKWSVHFFSSFFFFCHVLLLSNGRYALEFPSADGNVSVQPTRTRTHTCIVHLPSQMETPWLTVFASVLVYFKPYSEISAFAASHRPSG